MKLHWFLLNGLNPHHRTADTNSDQAHEYGGSAFYRVPDN